jgi:hypothetical protein
MAIPLSKEGSDLVHRSSSKFVSPQETVLCFVAFDQFSETNHGFDP